MSNSKYTDHTDYCTREVMAKDRERTLCMMMSPASARRGVVALLAWNIEIAKIGEVASEEMVGLIRFQWWRDALDEIYDSKPLRQHAVVLELAETIRAHDLPKEMFMDVLAAREADLDKTPFATLEAMDAYSCSTGGTLEKIWLRILGVDDKHAAEAAEHVGAAWALIGSLRASHHMAHHGKMRLPLEALEAAGVDAEGILQNGFTPPVGEAVQVVAELAEEHIRDARGLRRDVPKAALPALYLAVQAEDFLHRLHAAGYDLAAASIEKGRAKRALKLWWASLVKKY